MDKASHNTHENQSKDGGTKPPSHDPSSTKTPAGASTPARAPEKKPGFRFNPCCGELGTCGTVIGAVYIVHGIAVLVGVSVYSSMKSSDRANDLCKDIDSNCSGANSINMTQAERDMSCDNLNECRTREKGGMTMCYAAGILTLTAGIILVICCIMRKLGFLCPVSGVFGLISTALIIFAALKINGAALEFTDDYHESQKDHVTLQKAGLVGGPIVHAILFIYMAVVCVALFFYITQLNARRQENLEPAHSTHA